MSLRELASTETWGFHSPQTAAAERLVDHLSRSLPTSFNTLTDVVYDGSNRLIQFRADGFLYLFDYPDSTHITLSINGDLKQITLDGAGRITGVTSI